MAKKKLKKNSASKLTTKSLLLLGVLLILNFSSLYIHNDLLPGIYLVMLALYYLLNCTISKKGTINWHSGISLIFFKAPFKLAFWFHWGTIVFFPLFFALYYLDFVLLLATLLGQSIFIYLIWKENSLI